MVSILLFRCAFESDEEYFRELKIPDPKRASAIIRPIDLSSYNPGDTIDFFGNTSFFFSLTGEHGRLESATVYLNTADNTWNVIASGSTTQFAISKHNLIDGIFPLRLDLTLTSGSGSLADALGEEKFDISLTWFLRVDLSPPLPPTVNLEIVDGFLTLEWSAYKKPNFEFYEVNRKLPNGVTNTFQLNERQATVWRDESYVGGYNFPIEYSISIVSETGRATSPPISRIDPLDLRFSFDPKDSTFTFDWEPTPFYGPFEGYKINFETGKEIISLPNASTSTHSDKLSMAAFGAESSVGFHLQSKLKALNEPWHWHSFQLGTPITFSLAGKITFNSYLNSLIALDTENSLLQLNDKFEPLATLAILKGSNWLSPFPGNYVFSTSNNYSDDNIYRLQLATNAEVTYDYFYLGSSISTYSVAGNGLICLDYDRPPLPSANIPPLYVTRAFDPATNINVYTESSNTVKLSASISEDGKYIRADNDRVFKINGGSSELVGSFAGPGAFLGFRQDNSSEMMFADGDRINFYASDTFEFIRTLEPPKPFYRWFGSYDSQTKNMLWTRSVLSTDPIYAVHIETGKAKSVQVSARSAHNKFYLVNGFLVYEDHFIKLY
ncbi:MAG: hypothetical protein RIB47_08920 [Cyclobacteriaceae bacterium]